LRKIITEAEEDEAAGVVVAEDVAVADEAVADEAAEAVADVAEVRVFDS